MNKEEVENFSKYIVDMITTNSSYTDMDLKLDLDFIKALYENYINIDHCNSLHENNNTNSIANHDTSKDTYVNRSDVLDIRSAMDEILSQPGLMLNGEMLSDDSKIALANAIRLGLQYAEQMQKKEHDITNK